MYLRTRKSPLNFGSHPDLDPDPDSGIFNGIFSIVDPNRTPQRWVCFSGSLRNSNSFAGSAPEIEMGLRSPSRGAVFLRHNLRGTKKLYVCFHIGPVLLSVCSFIHTNNSGKPRKLLIHLDSENILLVIC